MRSQVWLISERMWEETMTEAPLARPRTTFRISTIWAGSRPLIGSSRMISRGLWMMAWAMPTRFL